MKVPNATMHPKNVLPPKPVQRRRLTCFSWNCNGLPPDHWDFLTQWMKNQTIDIVLLQENSLEIHMRLGHGPLPGGALRRNLGEGRSPMSHLQKDLFAL